MSCQATPQDPKCPGPGNSSSSVCRYCQGLGKQATAQPYGYTLSAKQDGKRKHEDRGGFQSNVVFEVNPPVDGFIVQKVTRIADITVTNTINKSTTKHTPADIDRGNQPYSNLTINPYWEIMPVKQGKSEDADSFSSGPLIYPNTDLEPSGKITQKGEATFYDNSRLPGVTANFHTNCSSSSSAAGPANGFDWTPVDPDPVLRVPDQMKSNTVIHTEEITFDSLKPLPGTAGAYSTLETTIDGKTLPTLTKNKPAK